MAASNSLQALVHVSLIDKPCLGAGLLAGGCSCSARPAADAVPHVPAGEHAQPCQPAPGSALLQHVAGEIPAGHVARLEVLMHPCASQLGSTPACALL